MENNNTSDNINQAELGKELDKCKQEQQELKQKYIYLNAEFDNFKKRSEKERTNFIASVQSSLLFDLLSVVDDFERALTNRENQTKEDLEKGLLMIQKGLAQILKKYNVTEINNITDFNPEIHEAILNVKADGQKSGQIVSVLQKGYKFKDQILRPAKVSVAE